MCWCVARSDRIQTCRKRKGHVTYMTQKTERESEAIRLIRMCWRGARSDSISTCRRRMGHGTYMTPKTERESEAMRLICMCVIRSECATRQVHTNVSCHIHSVQDWEGVRCNTTRSYVKYELSVQHATTQRATRQLSKLDVRRFVSRTPSQKCVLRVFQSCPK